MARMHAGASRRRAGIFQYWVVGGSYTDTRFRQIADPAGEAWHGPFATYAAAEWRRLAWSTVDDALARFRIEHRAGGPGAGRLMRTDMTQGWLVEGLGIVAATLTTGGMTPQVIRVWRRKSARDLSLAMYLMIWTGTILWLVYAFIVGSISLLYANGAALLLASLILYFKLRYD